MTLTLNGTSGVTTPGISNSEGYTGDGLTIAAGAPAGALTLDASGNLGVGTNGPSVFGTGSKLCVVGYITSGGVNYSAQFSDGITNTFRLGHSTGVGHIAIDSGAIAIESGGSERARIDSSGNLLVGTTTTYVYGSSGSGSVTGWDIAPNGGGNIGMSADVTWNRYTTGSVHGFRYNGSPVGAISISTTATTYATSSDYRLKEDIQPMTGALARVAALKPVTYNWKADGSADRGFIAHELQEVIPQAVSGEKDAVNEDGSIKPQGVDYGKITPELVAAIQEQQAMITELKARIEQLEAK